MNKKGIAALEIIIVTFFILVLLFVLGAMAIQNAVKQDSITIVQRDTLAVKNTFSLFNRSLDSTWSLSTVQALFEASEHGFESSSMFGDIPKNAYWYRFHPTQAADMKLPAFSDVPNRCNQPGGNPGICLPQQLNVQNFMNITMENIWFNLSEKRPYTILSKPAKISIPQNTENKLDIVVLRFWPAYDRFIYQIATHVIVEGSRSKINAYALSNGYIKTDIAKMIKFGWLVVSSATNLRWLATHDDSYKYTDSTPGFDQLNQVFSNYFMFKEKELSTSIKSSGSNFFVTIDADIDFKVPASSAVGHGLEKGGGLLVHYDAGVTIEEGKKVLNIGPATAISNYCKKIYNIDRKLYQDYFDGYEKYQPYIVYSRAPGSNILDYTDTPESLIAAIITVESNWKTDALSPAGAIGLMQVTPPTGLGDCILSEDELWDSEKNIKCGITVLIKKIERVLPSVKRFGSKALNDKNNMIKLALAAYNGGEGTVQEAIAATGEWRYEKIRSLLSDETRTYVPLVLDSYNFWQSCIGFGKPVIIDRTSDSIKGVNYQAGRTQRIDSVVIHHCGGGYEGCIRTLTSSVSYVGAHYVISKKGEITQLVDDNDRAFHANYYNSRSIGIETDGSGEDWTPELMNSLANLVRYLAGKYSDIKIVHPLESVTASCCDASCGIDVSGILGHSQICGDKIDPSNFPWDTFMEMINRGINLREVRSVLDITDSCSAPEDVGKYLCIDKNAPDEKMKKYLLHGCSESGGMMKQIELTPEELRILGIKKYPCNEKDCSDCTQESSENTIQNIEEYVKFLGNNFYLEDSYCGYRKSEGSDPRGNKHLAYNIYAPKNSLVRPAYDGKVIYATTSPPSYFDPCAGLVMVKSNMDNNIIAYSNIIPQISDNVDVTKDTVIGVVSERCKSSKDTMPHMEVRIMKSSFKILDNMENACGTKMDCTAYGAVGADVSIESFINPSIPNIVIPYWCSSFRWDDGRLYHLSSTEGSNIRYNEEMNQFEKDNFALRFSMEDWFSVLNCKGDEKRYSWTSNEDIMCYSDKLYSCERVIPGIGNQKMSDGQYLGLYKCVSDITKTGSITRFCKSGSGTEEPESQTEGKDNFCCVNWNEESEWVSSLFFAGYCKSDDYCSDNEWGLYSTIQDKCRYSSDCCKKKSECTPYRTGDVCA